MQLTILESAVTESWARGWQPVELASYVRRQCGGASSERLVVDVMAAEMRRYASVTVDSHWQAQLETLGAMVWWGRDELFFERWAQRQRVTVEAAARGATALHSFLGRIPKLPLLCPMPGRSRPGVSGVAIDQRLLDRVRALLAKAESTEFPEEAETYSAKAQELMARHSIDYALLSASSNSGEGPAGRRVQVDNPYETPKALLLDVTARANRSRSVWSRDLGFSTVFGFPTDVAGTELLYTSLLVQATTAMVHAGSPGDGRTASFRRSFLTGYAHRIDQRLQQATSAASESAAREYGSAMLPVLASRAEAVQEKVQEFFPTTQSFTTTVGNRAGWVAGQVAADRANLRPQYAGLGT